MVKRKCAFAKVVDYSKLNLNPGFLKKKKKKIEPNCRKRKMVRKR